MGARGGEPAGRLDTRLRRPALSERMTHPLDRMKWIQEDHVSGDQEIEERPERREGLVLGRRGVGELVQELTGQLRRHLV